MSDLTAPTLSSSTTSRTEIVLTFSEAMAAGTGYITITDGSTQTYMGKDGTLRTRFLGATDTRTIDVTDTSQVTVSGNTVTIHPTSGLNAGKTYSVQVARGALLDEADNVFTGLLDTSGLRFATSSVSAPSAVVTGTLTMTDTGSSGTDYITNSAAQTVSGQYTGTLAAGDAISVSLDNGATWNTATVDTGNHTWTYAGTIASSSTAIAKVVNAAGVSSGTVRHTYTFDTDAPTVASISLSDSALAAGETSTVTMTFSEAVTGLTTSDFTVTSGTLSDLASLDGGITWTATLTPSSVDAATNTITLDKSGVTDIAGNAGSGNATSGNYTVTAARPTVSSIALSDTALKAGETATITITLSEAVTGLTDADITVGNGTLSNLQSSNGITWTATLTPAANTEDATNVVTLNNTGYQDSNGNTGTGTTSSANYTVDTKAPTVTGLELSDTTLGSGDTATVTITFSEAVSGLTSSDFTVTGGTLGTLTSTDNITWTATLTPSATGSGTGSVQLAASSVADTAGNSGPSSAHSASFTYAMAPAVTIASVALSADTGDSASDFITKTAAQTITGTLSAALGSGEFVEVSLDDGGTWTNATVSGTSWTLSGQTLASSDTLIARVSNSGATGTEYSKSYTLDQSAPSATITLDQSNLLTGETATVTITFDDPVSGLTLSDLTYSGTLTGLSSSDGGTTWTATLTPSSNGSGEIRLGASTVTDVAGNSGPASDVTASFTYNATPTASIATATITDTGTSGDFITSSTSQVIAGTLSEALGRGQYVEVSLNNGDTWTRVDPSGTNWSLSGQTISASNTLKVRVTNGTTTGDTYSHSYTLDQTAPTLSSINLSDASLITGETATVTVVFDEAVYGLAATDFAVSGGSLGTFSTTDHITWTGTLTPTASGTVTLSASSVTDAAGNTGPAANSNSQSFTFTVDNTGPSATLALSDATLTAGQTATLTITFSEAVTDTPTTSDFTVTGGTLGAFTTTDGGTTWVATLTPTANAYGEGSITLAANAINDPSGNPGPSSAASLPFNYDTQSLDLSSTISFSSDSGESASDLITNTATQTISGAFSGGDIYTTMGAKIEVSTDNGSTWSSATVDNTTHTWSISKTLSGSSTIKVKLTDAAAATETVSHTYTIDTTGPGSVATRTVDLSTSSDSYDTDAGGTAYDNITNDDTPMLSFNLSGADLTAGDYIDVLDTSNSNAIVATYTIESSAVGFYGSDLNATPTAALSEGTHTLVLRARDAAGNTGTQSTTPLSITIDKTIGSMSGKTVDLVAGSDSGTSSTDNITNDDTPTVTVNVANTSGLAAGDLLQIIDTSNGDAVVGTHTLVASNYGSSGADISITLDSLDDGTHVLALRAVDKAGNTSTSGSTLSVTVDTVAPALSSSSPSSDSSDVDVDTASITLTFSEALVADSSTGFKISNSSDISDYREIVLEASSGNTGSYDSSTHAVTLSLSGALKYAGNYSVEVYNAPLTDTAGNTVAIGTALMTFVTESIATPSAVTLALTETSYATHSGTDNDHVTNNNLLAISGITASYLRYKLINDSSWTTLSVSGSTHSLMLPDGTYDAGDIQVQQYDTAGYESTSATLADDWTIDTTAPTAYATAPSSDFFGLGSLISIFSDVTGGIGGTLNGDVEFIEYTTDSGQTWSKASQTTSTAWALSSLKIDEGGYVGLRMTDTAGNTGSHDGLSGYVVYVGDGYGGTAFTASGNSTVYAQGGNDNVTVTGSNNTVYGGYGNDTLTVSGDDNTVSGDSGSNTFTISGDDNDISGGSYADTFTVTGDSNLVSMGDGGDTITVSGSGNTVYGEAGSDIITISDASATVQADDGDDTITLSVAYSTFTGSINGGDDSSYTDQLGLGAANQELNLASMLSKITHVERISLASNTEITISAAAAATMSDGARLYIIGDNTDTIVLNNNEWTPATMLSLVGYSGYYNSANDITLVYSNTINIDTGTA